MGEARNRIPYFDNLKGVLIILVVVGHFFNGALSSNIVPAWHIFNFIYAFHMPLFIFVSGVFCKNVFSRERGFRGGVVLYYLALCWLMYLALWAPQAVLGIADPFNLLTVNESMPWYLMAVAVYCALTPLFGSLRPGFAVAGAFVLSVLSGLVDVGNVFSLSRVVVFLPFFLIGFYVRPTSVLSWLEGMGGRLRWARVGAVLVVAALFVAFQFLDLDWMRFSQVIFRGSSPYADAMARLAGSSELLCCAVRLAGFLVSLVMGVCLLLLTPRGEVALLSRTGRHTLQVYIFHAFVSYALTYVGVAPLLYAALPSAAASGLIVVLGIAVSLALGWPNFVQGWFDKLKGAMDTSAVPVASARDASARDVPPHMPTRE